MNKKILIDLEKFRTTHKDGEYNFGECTYDFHPDNRGVKDLIELAMLHITCRRCEDAPCIAVCKEEALEKDEDGVVERATNLCVGCLSCVTVCPFGSLFLGVITSKKSICDLCDFTEDKKTLRCMETAPEGAITFTEIEADEAKHIYALNDKVLVKEIAWDDLKDNE